MITKIIVATYILVGLGTYASSGRYNSKGFVLPYDHMIRAMCILAAALETWREGDEIDTPLGILLGHRH